MPKHRLHRGDLSTEMQELMERSPEPGTIKGRSCFAHWSLNISRAHCMVMVRWRTAGHRSLEIITETLWKECVTFPASRNRDIEKL